MAIPLLYIKSEHARHAQEYQQPVPFTAKYTLIHDNCNNNGNKKAPFPHGKGAINRDILSIQIIQP